MTATNASIIKKLLILFLVFGGLHYAKDFLVPLCIGGVLATLFLPFCRKMQENKIPKGLSVVLCLLTLLGAISVIIMLLGWQISELTNDFVLLKQKTTDAGNRMQEYIFNTVGITTERQSQIIENEKPSVAGIAHMVAGSVTYILTNFILVLAYIFLMLYYRAHLQRFFLKLALPAQRNELAEVLNNIAHVSQQYLVGLAKMIGCLWIMYAIGFTLLGVKNAFFFAILCGLLEIIPFIGNITGTSLTVLVAAVQGASFPMLLGIVGTYIMVQLIQGWILEPIILGPQVKINPFTTVVVLVLGELVWGIAGVFLAIPLIAMFKIVCDHVDTLKPYGFLIGEIETVKGEPGYIKKIQKLVKNKLQK